MPNKLIKICGVTDYKSLNTVLQQEVDLVGFIFVKESPRYISVEKAKQFSEIVHNKERKVVAVFKNQSLSEVRSISKEIKADFIQLHGDESVAVCKSLTSPLIKAINISKKDFLEQMGSYKDHVKYFLLDRPRQGVGEVLSFSLVNEVAQKFSIFLAGGLSPQNIKDAVSSTSNAVGYDTASGVESEPGIKDFNKVYQFVSIIRGTAN